MYPMVRFGCKPANVSPKLPDAESPKNTIPTDCNSGWPVRSPAIRNAVKRAESPPRIAFRTRWESGEAASLLGNPNRSIAHAARAHIVRQSRSSYMYRSNSRSTKTIAARTLRVSAGTKTSIQPVSWEAGSANEAVASRAVVWAALPTGRRATGAHPSAKQVAKHERRSVALILGSKICCGLPGGCQSFVRLTPRVEVQRIPIRERAQRVRSIVIL